MNLDSQYNNRASVGAVDIAALSREKFLEMMGLPSPSNDSSMERWLDAVEMLFVICNEQQEVSWQKLSAGFAGKILKSAAWEEMPPPLKAVWEATTRHAVNLIMSEDREEFDLSKGHDWTEWVLKRIQSEPATGES